MKIKALCVFIAALALNISEGIKNSKVHTVVVPADFKDLHKGKARTVKTVRAFLVLAYLLIDAAVATLKGAGR